MSKFTKASIILGAVTETNSLRHVVEIIEEICSPEKTEEIIIQYPENKVTPGCRAVISELISADYPIPVIANTDKRPFLAGLLDAVDIAGGSHIVFCDSDMGVDPKCIPGMIESACKEPDTIFTCSRFLPGCTFHGYNKLRLAVNKAAQLYLRILFNTDITDLTAPYQIVSSDLLKALNFEETGFPIFLELILKPLRLGVRIKEFPTDCYGRTEGKSSNSFIQTAMYLRTSLHIRFMKKDKIIRYGSEYFKQNSD